MHISLLPPTKTGKASPGKTSATSAVDAEFTQWFAVRSSNISSIRYRKSDSTLDVAFQDGNVYRLEHVPETVFIGLTRAISPGKFYATQLQHTYRATRQ